MVTKKVEVEVMDNDDRNPVCQGCTPRLKKTTVADLRPSYHGRGDVEDHDGKNTDAVDHCKVEEHVCLTVLWKYPLVYGRSCPENDPCDPHDPENGPCDLLNDPTGGPNGLYDPCD